MLIIAQISNFSVLILTVVITLLLVVVFAAGLVWNRLKGPNNRDYKDN